MEYNLLKEEWIPVLWNDGRTGKVGIIEALVNAHRIRQIAASNPMDRVAILRFLLAILYWCRGNPPEDEEDISGEPFPENWFSKVEDQKDCFNLLGDGKRFYQDRTASRKRTVTELLQEIPTGNNFWHFRHSTDEMDGLCPSCCAMGLLRLPLFSVSGLPDLKAGINGTPPVYVVPYSRTLSNTLRLNWLKYEELGDPIWIRTNIHTSPNISVPLLTGLTLLSRRVLLHNPSAPPGSCVGCGSKTEFLIRKCEYQTAGEQKNDNWDDPHVVYGDRIPRSAIKAPDPTTAGRFRMDRKWTDLITSMIVTGKYKNEREGTFFLVVGFATDKAKNIDVWERTVFMPKSLFVPEKTTSLIQQWQKKGGQLEKDKWISRAERERSAIVAAIRPHVEKNVSDNIGELLIGDEESWKKASDEYRPMMEIVAKSLSPGFTAAAVERRRRIAGVKPEMGTKVKLEKKSGRKKGGSK